MKMNDKINWINFKDANAKVGDIFDTEVVFSKRLESKIRPTIVIYIEDGKALAISLKVIGTKDSGKYYDKYKIPILSWSDSRTGLTKPSYVQCDVAVELSEEVSVSYRGKLNRLDLRNVIDKYYEYLSITEFLKLIT